MQAIRTKFLGATNTRGSRIKAWCEAGSLTVGWDHGKDVEFNHLDAGMALVSKLGWDSYGRWVMGCLPHPDSGFCLVCVKPPTCPDCAVLMDLALEMSDSNE